MHVNKQTANKALEVLQGIREGDKFEAANQLAARMLIEMNTDDDNGLTDWLHEGDFDGDETIASLIVEWKKQF